MSLFNVTNESKYSEQLNEKINGTGGLPVPKRIMFYMI